MKVILTLLLATIFSAVAYAIPHIPIDSAGPHYKAYISSEMSLFRPMEEVQDSLQPVLRMGERNLEWLKEINKNQKDKISLTTPENMQAFPIEAPRVYNVSIILDEFNGLKNTLPAEMADILFSSKALPKSLPISKEEYIQWAFKVDRNYQIAVRWRMMEPYLGQLAARKYQDVRGYYYLKDISNLNEVLNDYINLDQELQDELKLALVGICFNTRRNENRCIDEFNSALNIATGLVSMKNRYWGNSENIWNGYFDIPRFSTYRGLFWPAANPNIARVPFKYVSEPIKSFLKENIEDEYQFGDFKLIADFEMQHSNAVRVVFQPGIVPHVKGLGSNTMYMDSNTPLDQWDVQWTIRHEFGHVLGLPDCYHEFYDSNQGVIIGYQIDITDLMCSRRGVMNERIYDQLKAAYYGR